MRLGLAVVFAGSVLLGCHEAPTSPTVQPVASKPRLGATTTGGSFEMRELASLGGDWSDAKDVNAAGDIVGSSADSNGISRPTLWPADGSAPRRLGNLDEVYKGASADAINTAGDVVGMDFNSTGDGPTLWPAGGGPPRDLGSLSGASSTVRAMNDAGDVVGDSYFPTGTHATFWPAGGPPRDLTPGQQSSAEGINSAGTIVGVILLSDGRYQATTWPAGGGAPHPLGTLAPGASSSAAGINDAGDVVGASWGGNGPSGATLWPAGGGAPRILGEGSAEAINSAGDVVGSAPVPTGEMHAMLWPADGSGPQDLGALEAGDYARAAAINSSRRIVGVSQSTDPYAPAHAVVWVPVVQQSQSITFTSTPPSGAIVGGTYSVSATGGGSGNAVTFTSLAPAVCSVSGNAVSLNAGGTCTIAADQAGGTGYLAAPQVTQSFDINTRPVANAGAAQTGNEGSTIAFNAGNSSDADGDALVAYTWDFGDGTVLSVSSPAVAHTYSDNKPGGGAYVVTLQVTDARGATSTVVNTSALIGNIAPVATFNPASPVGEGTINLSLTGAQDAPGDVSTLQYAFDCGSGTGYGAYSASSSTACVVPDNGVRTVRAKIKDKDGAETEYTKSVTVVNVAPTIAITSAPSGKTGVDYTLAFRFTDPGTADAPWLYQILWGDGKRDAAPKSVSVQGSAISESYRYNKAGTYSIAVRVTDNDGSVAISTVQVTIVK
jgi:probable HAF family extracellular repeat protein